MLKLKKLQILGFKSFCDRTELKFHGDGIAAIVGPNGCGKSNIADAISWVLGEQSAKSLRGVNMQDVIFAGTRDRKPTGMAEVSLTLIDPDQYEGVVGEPEIEIHDEMPEDDWDETAIRTAAQEEVEEYTAEVRPGAIAEGEESAQAQDPQRRPRRTSKPPRQNLPKSSQPKQPHTPPIRRWYSRSAAASSTIISSRRERSVSPVACSARATANTCSTASCAGCAICRTSSWAPALGRSRTPSSSRDASARSSRASRPTAAPSSKKPPASPSTRRRSGWPKRAWRTPSTNLSRINDIFDEVTRQMNSLKRQAAKAERYAKLRDEMREKLRVVLASKFAQIDAEITGLEAELTTVSEDIHARTEAVTAMDAEHGERAQRGYAIDAEAKQNRENLNNLSLRDGPRNAASPHQRRTLRGTRRALRRGRSRDRQHHRTTWAPRTRTCDNKQVLESAAADVAVAQSDLQSKQQEASAAAANLMNVEREQEQRRVSDLPGGECRLQRAQPDHAGGRAHCRAGSRTQPPYQRDRTRTSNWRPSVDSAAS